MEGVCYSCVTMKQSNNLYITTTLPYVNAPPHVGFAMEIIRADTLARYFRARGSEVFFNTGTDEHGAKIYENAVKENCKPQAYADRYATKFKELIKELNISNAHFIRTTDEMHVEAAQEMWRRCNANGDIYKKLYKTKYCVGCELEKTDSELVDGHCPLHPNRELEIREEENYYFRFSKYEQPLLDFYDANPEFVIPDFRFNEIKSFVSRGLEDFSISRLKSKMPWGVPVPDDGDHVMYVWFDALTSYISTLGWPSEHMKYANNTYVAVRHGESVGNVERLSNTHDYNLHDLTKRGITQAKDGGRKIADNYQKIDIVISSPFKRCLQTAKHIVKELGFSEKDIVIDERIREAEAITKDDAPYGDLQIYDAEGKVVYDKSPEGAESVKDVESRLVDFFADIESRYKGKNILLITHHLPLRMMTHIFQGDTAKLIAERWEEKPIEFVDAISLGSYSQQFEKFWENGSPIQYCGKDNNRQQSAMWQAMLMSAKLPSSRHIVIDGFITSGGQKMSKSLGNVINPFDVIEAYKEVAQYPEDVLRFVLLHDIPSFEDGDLTLLTIQASYSAHLQNGVGNLTSRIMKMATTHLPEAVVLPKPMEHTRLDEVMQRFDLKLAIEQVMLAVGELDKYIQETAPFKVVKVDLEEGQELIREMVERLYAIALVLEPFLPRSAAEIMRLVREHKMPEKPLFNRLS